MKEDKGTKEGMMMEEQIVEEAIEGVDSMKEAEEELGEAEVEE